MASLPKRRVKWMVALAPLLLSTRAGASDPSLAHHMLGLNAMLGSRGSAILYQEASGDSLDLHLALAGAQTLERAALDLSTWLGRVANGPPAQAIAVADEIAVMLERSASALKRTQELKQWVESRIAAEGGGEPARAQATPELREKIAHRCQETFYDFALISRQEKIAETKLDLVYPPEPPVPEGGPTPAK